MPRYMFLLFDDEAAWEAMSEAEQGEVFAQHDRFTAAVEAEGATLVGGEALQPTSTATVVRAREGADPEVTDGPFVELKEAFGAFYLIEAADLDQALRLAAVCPSAGGVEVRPVMEMPEE